MLIGRRAEGGWRCAVTNGAGGASPRTDRELPLATTLGDLLAGRGPNATGPTEPTEPPEPAGPGRP